MINKKSTSELVDELLRAVRKLKELKRKKVSKELRQNQSNRVKYLRKRVQGRGVTHLYNSELGTVIRGPNKKRRDKYDKKRIQKKDK